MASRGLARRAWAPTGHLNPRGSSPKPKSLLRRASAPSSGSSWSGARASGAPLCQRPTIFAPSRSSSVTARRPVAQVAPVGRHLGVQLPEDDVGAVATQDLRGRHRRQLAGLVGVAQDDLAGLEGSLAGTRGGPAASLDRGLADAVLETERGPSGGELVAVLTPDHLDSRELGVGLACLLGGRLEPSSVRGENRDGHVHVGAAERRLPVLGTALTDVAQQPRRALPSLRGTPGRSCPATSAGLPAPPARW